MNGIRKDLNCRPHSLDEGFSFVELMVVIVIIVIVATLALMQRGSANEQFQRQNVSQQLKVALERARFDSVKRRAVGGAAPFASVTITSNSFTLRTYRTDVNGVAVASDQIIANPPGIVIARYDGTAIGTAVVNFDMRGETSQTPEPQFLVCNVSCSSPTNATADVVLVTSTGTVNLLPGSNVIPEFNSPPVSTAPAPSINPDVVLP